ncbi:TonB-dependent receptor plug domain-containing protein [Sphingomonas jeddahensis]|uniref:Vitamin B12 transporter BtuB n=1 Tax=Sphingomonas jeddahensis TaxID=1915074 RepID=A0A1V2ES75_9SPHN|nr:TonB-dependent receptor [Sphingomonas jeddahensis]ONF95383.1 Vitamin B12 transporter BtuB precursor [Sphingomonas jeddahensis]
MKLINMLACCSVIALSATTAAAQTPPTDLGTVPDDAVAGDAAKGTPGQSQTDALDPAADEAPRASASSTDGDIIVTGSRVVSNGYQAPTPITVVGSEDLKNAAPNISDALRQLPQLTGSTGPSTPSFTPGGSVSSTSSTANLRNLGITRTLVLLDGRRPPASGVTGTSDIAAFPQQLIKRVDIVTGGASAAYGSDAVAGVVNFVLDTKFRGVMAELRNGISTHGDGHSWGAEASAGFGFADDRGSLIVSGSIMEQDPIDGRQRDWANRGWATIPNPTYTQTNGQPQLLLREDVNLAAATYGGIITGARRGATRLTGANLSGALRDIQFGPGGEQSLYQHGSLFTGTVEVGGEGPRYPAAIVSDLNSKNAFAHAEFEVSNNFSVFAEGSYGYSKSAYPLLMPFFIGSSGIVVQRDNAYLPANIRAIMDANGYSSIELGKLDGTWGQNEVTNITKTLNLTTGFKAELGGFTVDGYYEHGESRYELLAANQRNRANTLAAADAVVNPATGQIVCRSSLTNPSNGCVAWNPFGTAPITQAQRDYMGGSGFARSIAKQDVVALTVRGNLFSTWAGDVAAAVGAEYRDLSGSIEVDPISGTSGFIATNPQGSAGSYDVKEAFGEILVPLFRGDNFLQSIDFNGAVRRTDYSTSGGVTTWKLGLTSEIIDGLRLRGTYSRDIRAPNIGDLFGPRSRNVVAIIDPFRNNQVTQNVFTFTGSNPNLVPERAKTIAAGLSYRPSFLPGFGFSIDYYKIKIEDAITTLSAQQLVNQCFAGDQSLCALTVRGADGQLSDVNGIALNIATVQISGLDFDASYSTDLFGGKLSLRGIATYLDDYTQEARGVQSVQYAGTGSFPSWRANLQATYTSGGTTISLQERFIGAHRRAIPPVTVDVDRVPEVFYTNLTIRQQIEAGNAKPELFLTINNLFDKDPPPSDTNNITLGTSRVVDPLLYDTIGRYITVGGRIRF